MGAWLVAAVVATGLLAGTAEAQRNKNPTISLSASATQVAVNATSVLTAVAADPDGTIAKVDFYVGLAKVSTVTTAPYKYNYMPTATGTATLWATATDNSGAVAASGTIQITAVAGGNVPPTVSLAASQMTFQTGDSTVLTATAADSDGTVSKVAFFSNGTQIAVLNAAPWTYTWFPTVPGNVSVTAVATDNQASSTTSAALAITIKDGGPRANAPPVVTASASPASVTVNTPTTITAVATDSDGIAKVEFYNAGTLFATDTTAPYSATFTPTTVGTVTLTVKAYDTLGASTPTSVTVTATAAPVGSQLPRVTLALAPTTLFTPGSVITLNSTAAATATGATVTKVAFFMNGVKLLDDTVAPYTTTATLPSAGNYDFYAQVTDSLGQTMTTLTQRAVVQAAAPPVASTSADVWRLLNQATFGASQAEAARVVSLGIAGWINDQLTQPISGYPDTKYNRIQLNTTVDCTNNRPDGTAYPADSPQAMCVRDHLTLAMIQRDFFINAATAPDQLRQRVAWALSQIVVTSANEPDLSYAHVMSRYQNIMFQEAFGNYENLLRKVTYNPAMGNYLDMVNNDRPAGSTVPNENYAREIMQLFSVGLYELNTDGTYITDASGNPVPTYGQPDIAQFARTFTGYTYTTAANPAGPAPGKQGRYYGAPMVPYPTTATTGHDTNAKTLLNGTVLPAGQTAQVDIDAAVRNVFMHPNTGPFVASQLIQRLVTGNPTPAYVGRVAAVFNNNGAGVRGDMTAVVKAILLDTEARGAAKTAADFGQLREPVLVVTSLIRALNGITDGNRLDTPTANLGQRVYYSPTVFNYFMPDSKVPGTSILGPEFGIHTTVTAVGRANLIYSLVYGGLATDGTIPASTGTRLYLAPFEAIADNPAAMVSLLNKHLAGGQFPAALEPTIVTAVTASPISATPTAAERTARARMAVYLMASSYDYQVQR